MKQIPAKFGGYLFQTCGYNKPSMETRHRAVLHDAASNTWLHFEHPHIFIQAYTIAEVKPALREIEECVNRNGWYAVGFISYEASPAFDNVFSVRPGAGFPLLWFGLFSEPRRSTALLPVDGEYKLGEWTPTVSRETYNAAIRQVKANIEHGNTYQVNYTFRLRNQFQGSAWSMFVEMVNAQAAGYSAYVETGTHIICSASPELFFRSDGDLVTCRPMKGTVKRGHTLAEDNALADWLKASVKNRAENVMIVDMIRNDLGRVAEIGSVRVPELFTTERYATLWQMTSGVTAQVKLPFADLVSALFPCASITGAPKVSTMNIIAALETTPRKVYTGAIGYLAPGRKAQFSVGIRTMLLDLSNGQAEYGVGGGIVWDSTQKDEYAEALLKARILTVHRPAFSLLETLRWTPDEGFWLLAEHMQRLADSAEYFNFPFDREKTSAHLEQAAIGLPQSPQRLRLLLDKDGRLSHQVIPLSEGHNLEPAQVLVRIALEPVRSDDVFLYHKTTLRTVYEKARQELPGCDDVLLYNERGEMTESTIANLVVDLDGELLTPPVECGLLAGTMRAHLLKEGKVREKTILRTDLGRCQQLYLVNSVRGWRKAKLQEPA